MDDRKPGFVMRSDRELLWELTRFLSRLERFVMRIHRGLLSDQRACYEDRKPGFVIWIRTFVTRGYTRNARFCHRGLESLLSSLKHDL
jgi:hypothetical protein